MPTREEIEARRNARRADSDKKRDAQEVADLEAIDALESEKGESFETLTASRYVDGLPVKVAYRAPTALEYRRYTDTASRALAKNDTKARQSAQEALASTVWVYPADKETRERMQDAMPGLLLSIAVEAPKLAELARDQEGK